MKLLNRSYQHRNIILFIFMAMIYLQSILGITSGMSFLDKDLWLKTPTSHLVILILGLMSIYFVFFLKRHSDKIMLIFISILAIESFIHLAGSFNKLILILNFIYLIFSFYFFMSWEVEITKACFNPKFWKNDLEKSKRFNIQSDIRLVGGKSLSSAQITNLDEKSCFLLVEKMSNLDDIKFGDVKIELVTELEGIRFVSAGEVISVYDQGVGVKFVDLLEKNNTKAEWSELYKVCLERGLFT